MSNSEDNISVERESVETMLTVLKRLRGIFNPDLALLKENAPGMAAFAERMDTGIARLQFVLENNSEATLSMPRDAAEEMVARIKRFRGNFNPDRDALQEIAPGVAAFTKRLEDASAKLERALQ
jgi:hypothetical protein